MIKIKKINKRFKKLRKYFTPRDYVFKKILKSKTNFLSFIHNLFISFILAVIFVLPLYLFALFVETNLDSSLSAKFILSLSALISGLIWIRIHKKLAFYFGFFASLLLFYWIGISFLYSPLSSLAIPVSLIIAIVYACLFYLGLFYKNLFFRVFSFILIGFIHPFGFDWLEFRAFFAYSFFGVVWLKVAAAMLGFNFLFFRAYGFKILAILLLIFSLDVKDEPQNLPNFINKIALIETFNPQGSIKTFEDLENLTLFMLEKIDESIIENKEVIVFPETIFPLVLNETEADSSIDESSLKFAKLFRETMLEKSKQITIILGAFSYNNNALKNSTFIFENENLNIKDKFILAPFGEKIPLPDFLARPLYKFFFNMNDVLRGADSIQTFTLFNSIFYNAICYEGTSRILHETMAKNNVKFMMMISNNSWVMPSIEPVFQRMLLKFYARLFDTTIFHTPNMSKSYIISKNHN